jgi:hypothetical protein
MHSLKYNALFIWAWSSALQQYKGLRGEVAYVTE